MGAALPTFLFYFFFQSKWGSNSHVGNTWDLIHIQCPRGSVAVMGYFVRSCRHGYGYRMVLGELSTPPWYDDPCAALMG